MKRLVNIGWLVAVDVSNEKILRNYDRARQGLLKILSDQFPQFRWEMPFVHRRQLSPHQVVDPLVTLELGVHEKIYRTWDYVLVIVPNELKPRDRVFTIGVPSSALEVAVLSTARLEMEQEFSERLVGLALHLLGHMWGLEHRDIGPMMPPEECETLCARRFLPDEAAAIIDRLEEVADARVEEQQATTNWLTFHWHAFWADPKSIVVDIWGYAPWKIPFRMGRLTAAAAISVVFLLLGAESWEIGVNLSILTLIMGAAISVVASTLFIFLGQNLSQISREIGWREQLSRTRILLFLTLLLGMLSLWAVLFAILFAMVLVVPRHIPVEWLGQSLEQSDLARHAAFMATLGVFAGALGGNLEEENELKARLFYDEET